MLKIHLGHDKEKRPVKDLARFSHPTIKAPLSVSTSSNSALRRRSRNSSVSPGQGFRHPDAKMALDYDLLKGGGDLGAAGYYSKSSSKSHTLPRKSSRRRSDEDRR